MTFVNTKLMGLKEDYISLRINKNKKTIWKSEAKKRGLSLTAFIEILVEGNLLKIEQSKVMSFLDQQQNYFSKVETNINQFAKVANMSKNIDNSLLQQFEKQLVEVVKLKDEQNKSFEKVYQLLYEIK